MKRLKILYRKNLKMTANKQSAQCCHASINLVKDFPVPYSAVIVLGVSDKKFWEAVNDNNGSITGFYLVKDTGRTEVPPGTFTALAFYEEDPYG